MFRKIAWNIYGRYAWDDNRTESDFFDSVLDQIKAEGPGLKILDAGCGSGIYSHLLARMDYQVTGIDFSSGMIDKAENRLKDDKPEKPVFLKCDLNKRLPFADGIFDIVLLISVLQNVSDPIFTLNELNRVLKPNAIIILVHYPPYLKNKSLKEEVNLKFERSKKKSSGGKVLLYLKSFLERKGMSNYWDKDELMDFLSNSEFKTIRLIKHHPYILSARKS